MTTGYMHHTYAESLAEFGQPRPLPASGGWVLQRRIAGFSESDAMGCYPLFACRDWSYLTEDLADLDQDLVSLALVTDPFGDYDVEYLYCCFKDLVIPFKEHFVVDLREQGQAFIAPHHRRSARKGLQNLEVERCTEPARLGQTWVELYAHLVERHHIRGLRAFSRQALLRQLTVPGIVAFRAVAGETTVGMVLWYEQDGVAYYHLGAYSQIGYTLRASFALFFSSLEYFARAGLRWLDLGAGAGLSQDGTDGLSRFKRGWATGTRTAYFCGRIFNYNRYTEIVEAKRISTTGYFPAYRQGEFG